MNVTVETLSDCDSSWLPSDAQCEFWITNALTTANYNKNCGISLKFVNEAESGALNSSYRGKSNATNVLSFPADLPVEVSNQLDYLPLGDIVICPSVLEREAQEQAKTIEAHWSHLLTHGVLHLLGYEHDNDKDAREMESLEVKSLKQNGFADPYDNEPI